MLWRVYIKETALTVLLVKAVCKLFIIRFFIDKARCSQPARREFYPRFVRPFATRLVDNFCLFEGKNYSHSTRTVKCWLNVLTLLSIL